MKQMTPFLSRIVFGVLLFSLLPSSGSQVKQPDFSEQARRSDFSAFVRQFEENYAYADRAEKPWLTWEARYGGAVTDANSREAFDTVIAAALSELHDFHAEVRSPVPNRWLPVPTFADIWAEFRGSQAMVVAVRKGSDAERQGVRVGDAVIAVGSDTVADAVGKRLTLAVDQSKPESRNWALLSVLTGRAEEARSFTMQRPDGTTNTVTLPVKRNFERGAEPLSVTTMPGEIGMIRFNNSLGNQQTVTAFDHALENLRSTRGLLLDLRDVPSGGDSSVALGIMGRFVDKVLPYQRHRIPRYGQADVERNWVELVTPRGPFTYTAPLVILVDHWTGSMGEGMAIGFDAMHRGMVVGTSMAKLAGAVEDFHLAQTGVDVAYATEQLFHVNGTPRHQWLPPVIVAESLTGQDDPVLQRGIKELQSRNRQHEKDPCSFAPIAK